MAKIALLFLLLGFSEVLFAIGIRCPEEVEAQLAQERAELQLILEKHHSGFKVDGRIYGLPQHDFDDESNITIRQRLAYRRLNPKLPPRGSGPYQYPRTVYDLMNRLDVTGAEVCPQGHIHSPASDIAYAPDAVVVLPNVNATTNTQLEGEDYLEIDPTNQQYLVGASNSLTLSGQVVHRSSDYGNTWSTVELIPVRSLHSDPGVNFTSNGTVYSCTLDYTVEPTAVVFYKSTDHGATWPTRIVVDDANGNDKELATIDNQLSSGCRDQIYICWDDGNFQYVSSTTAPNTDIFRPKTVVQTGGQTIGCDIAAGPPATAGASAPVYTAWADTVNKEIHFSKSLNCGSSWTTPHTVIATTNEDYDYCIPAQDARRILIYPSVDSDRSNGPRKGWIYVVWNDLSAARNNCGQASDTKNSNVYLSRSSDGGSTWSAPVIVHTNPAATDQFNPWMRVDDADGTIHISWHDTRDDTVNREQTNLYYTRSSDGGVTFDTPLKVTTEMTDESKGSGSNDHQYGDYEGLAVRNGVVYPFWTDRRPSSGTDEEVFVAKICSEPKAVGSISANDIDVCVRNGVQLTWIAPSIFWGDGGQGTRKYQLRVDGALQQDNISEAAVNATYSPGDGASHTYEIRAVNSCTNFTNYTSASLVDSQDLIPPDTAGWNSLLALKNVGNVDMTWGSVTGAANYNVYRDTIPNSLFGPSQRINPSPISGNSYPDTPPASTIFFYQIKAADGCANEAR